MRNTPPARRTLGIAGEARQADAPLAREGKSQQRHGRADREDREHEGAQADVMGRPDHRDSGEHRAGARDVEQAESEAHTEPGASAVTARRQPGERPLEQVADRGDQRQPDDDQHRDAA